MYLTLYCEGLIFFCCLLWGYQLEPVMKNPLLTSRSPSDFWGRRWNLVVHRVLKGGVFKPVRKYFSRTTAMIAAFLASGVFHEWLLNTIFSQLPHQLDENGECHAECFQPIYGAAIVFFTWQAGLVGAEIMVGHTAPFQAMAKTLPLPLRTFLLVCLGIPLAHFFCEPYVRSNFFYHAQPGLPMILRVES